jgi:hypothetical protein
MASFPRSVSTGFARLSGPSEEGSTRGVRYRMSSPVSSYLGLDIGTSVTKAAVFDSRGRGRRGRDGSGGSVASGLRRVPGGGGEQRRRAGGHRRGWSDRCYGRRLAGGRGRRAGSARDPLGRRPSPRMASTRRGGDSGLPIAGLRSLRLGDATWLHAAHPRLAREVRVSIAAARSRRAHREGLHTVLSRCGGTSVIDPFGAGTLTPQRRPRATCSSPRRLASGAFEPR